ncbi:MAG: aldehyde dehydrogenase family protein [Betaproteobacteria bacterium]|nr:MAG: aldehyde dehydrogenase family protein [Betaproteobacteria bacterium]
MATSGPIVVITAFNFPAPVWAWSAFITAVCGDTVVWKPSPKAPLTAIVIQKVWWMRCAATTAPRAYSPCCCRTKRK